MMSGYDASLDLSTHPLKFAWRTVRRHRRLLSMTIGLRIIWELMPMLVPLIVGRLVDELTSGPMPSAITSAAVALLSVGLLQGLALGAYTEASGRLGIGVVADIRATVLSRLFSSRARQLNRGDLLTRALRDPDRLRGFVDRVFVRTPTTAVRTVFPTTMLFAISPDLACWALAPIVVQQAGTHLLQRRLQRATRAAAEAHAILADRVQADLNCLAPPRHSPDLSALEQASSDVERCEQTSQRMVAAIRAFVWLCTSTGLALVWYRGSYAVQAEWITVGALVSFAGYTTFVYRPFRQFTQILKTYQSGLASLERIAALVDEPSRTGQWPSE
ncbi:MAG: ABC transporter ATP-binding protein [Myxococcota bacterium]